MSPNYVTWPGSTSAAALLFPGQGSQHVGMGKALYESFPEARAVFEAADRISGLPLTETMFEGPEERLHQTVWAQPALLTASVAAWQVLAGRLPEPPAVALGLSLGEWSALVAAGVLSFEQALPLVIRRARLMQDAVPAGRGGMAAILGLPAEAVERLCQSVPGVVTPANYNSATQIVVSGEKEAVEAVMVAAREAGAKRVVPVAISVPAHSPLMASAREALSPYLAETVFGEGRFPVLANATARPYPPDARATDLLLLQLTSAVLLDQSLQACLQGGIHRFIEVGPGKVLSNLVQRLDRSVQTGGVWDAQSLEDALDLCRGVC